MCCFSSHYWLALN